ncbi:MAG: hypothetical protein JW736_00555 [Deltaproteobacteria bacterium]|nr:hypothetical protein [Deltaproteobacteria bacterium]MBN2687413.1 hypothetical protein [Deltaproteobacteria bacterium]
MERTSQKLVVTGALILIALGALILLNSTRIYGFNDSWPVLFIVIAVGLLVQHVKNVSGWLVGVVGVIFMALKRFYPGSMEWAKYVIPVIMILSGVFLLYEWFKTGRRKKII